MIRSLARVAVAAVLVGATPLGAQTNLERVVNGAFTPSHDYDLLDMGRALGVRSATPARSWAHPGDTLVVRLARPAGFGDTVRFTVDYHARLRQGQGLYFF